MAPSIALFGKSNDFSMSNLISKIGRAACQKISIKQNNCS